MIINWAKAMLMMRVGFEVRVKVDCALQPCHNSGFDVWSDQEFSETHEEMPIYYSKL
jgi:hypothetical protein